MEEQQPINQQVCMEKHERSINSLVVRQCFKYRFPVCVVIRYLCITYIQPIVKQTGLKYDFKNYMKIL